jgi:hypothetical protein
MSWGERSCARVAPCGFSPTIETCNVCCKGYKWDGETKPDSVATPCSHEFVSRDYIGQPYGRCIACGAIVS